jgi:TatD DNase family protein
MSLFNFHTYYIDAEPCLLNVDTKDLLPSYPEHVRLSIGVHPWKVKEDWRDALASVRKDAIREDVWAIGECGLDKLHGEALSLQMEAFRAQIAIAEEVQKPMVIHCVRAFDELLMLRRELEASCKHESGNRSGNVRHPQPWVIHGFRGKPEQAKQLMTKGMLLSFGHQYNLETLRFVYASLKEVSPSSSSPGEGQGNVTSFFLETDDLHLSVRQIYEQVARHLDVDVAHLSHLCDPRTTLFSRQIP